MPSIKLLPNGHQTVVEQIYERIQLINTIGGISAWFCVDNDQECDIRAMAQRLRQMGCQVIITWHNSEQTCFVKILW